MNKISFGDKSLDGVAQVNRSHLRHKDNMTFVKVLHSKLVRKSTKYCVLTGEYAGNLEDHVSPC